ncbi:glycosyltransferase family 2 protein [Campylobacter sp. MIT 97-5078]|uniref:glycosyltransferase family 2 protein n=1 Tax=Campylobacter sp. MIT 97-5078 TaxID=1548153 RepID=UPI00068BE021|nr:glycosyltransferase family 2 protein [Campylobacter sp. MIT 97-5078]TQR27095.1 glycosyltransferase family 2 protein [Campylobacter sp. MIT 97-5078]
MQVPKFSIILPTYNVQAFIAQALQSCINQTFKDIEIIVVDDCGQDSSIEIAKEFALKDERVKIIHNEKNQGVFIARNNGALVASGEYLLFLDPDDYFDERACEILFEIIDKNKSLEIDFISFNCYSQEKQDASFEKHNLASRREGFVNKDKLLEFYFDNDMNFGGVVFKLCRKEAYLSAISIIGGGGIDKYGRRQFSRYSSFVGE